MSMRTTSYQGDLPSVRHTNACKITSHAAACLLLMRAACMRSRWASSSSWAGSTPMARISFVTLLSKSPSASQLSKDVPPVQCRPRWSATGPRLRLSRPASTAIMWLTARAWRAAQSNSRAAFGVLCSWIYLLSSSDSRHEIAWLNLEFHDI